MRPNFRSCRGFFILIPVAIFLLAGLAVMLLWNALLPAILGISAITYMQAIGIFLLSRLLFGNFGFKRGFGHKPGIPYLKREFQNLSDEEKEKLRQQWKNRCSH